MRDDVAQRFDVHVVGVHCSQDGDLRSTEVDRHRLPLVGRQLVEPGNMARIENQLPWPR
jgi:hypothetical protein